jgi:hypothetical protein
LKEPKVACCCVSYRSPPDTIIYLNLCYRGSCTKSH